MSITLNQILALVGKLDDSQGDDTPRERFRRFLKDNTNEVGQVRDYIEECLRTSGDQYNRALQDLVNYLGHFLEFDGGRARLFKMHFISTSRIMYKGCRRRNAKKIDLTLPLKLFPPS